MHKNPIWLCFLTLVLLMTLVYTGKMTTIFYHYLQLSSETEVAAIAWSVKTEAEDEFVPQAKYTFAANGQFYSGSTLFHDDAVNNPMGAEESLKALTGKDHRVWYSPKNPQMSSLQKNFPLKESVYTAILWGLLIYFFWLGVYVAKLQRR